jgi:hypothetical protein
LKYLYKDEILTIKNGSTQIASFNIEKIIKVQTDVYSNLDSSQAVIESSTTDYDFRLIINQVSGNTYRDNTSYNYFDGVLLVRDKRKN